MKLFVTNRFLMNFEQNRIVEHIPFSNLFTNVTTIQFKEFESSIKFAGELIPK